LNDKKK